MRKRERTWATIPPYIVNILMGLICVWVGTETLKWPVSHPRVRRGQKAMVFAIVWGLILVLGSCIHCTICPKGLIIQFLWIPFRFVRWENIGCAEFLDHWYHSKNGAKMDGRGLFITTKNCPGFFSEMDPLFIFRLKHPFGSLFFRFLPIRQKLYVELFCRYFPELDFQVGTEEILQK